MQEQSKCVDSLDISEEEQRAIVAELMSTCRTPQAADKRWATRFRYSVREGLQLEVEGPQAAFVVRPRNLPTGGVSFLHGSFLYSGTGCAVTLGAIDGRRCARPGGSSGAAASATEFRRSACSPTTQFESRTS